MGVVSPRPASSVTAPKIVELNGGRVVVGFGSVLRGSIQADASVVIIGSNVTMNRSCIIRASEGAMVVIGDGCLLSNVEIYSSDLHSVIDVRTGDRLNPAAPVLIGDRVWLGAGVTVLPGVTIGNDTVIGAGSVVTKDIPANVVAAGVPAKVVRTGVAWLQDRI